MHITVIYVLDDGMSATKIDLKWRGFYKQYYFYKRMYYITFHAVLPLCTFMALTCHTRAGSVFQFKSGGYVRYTGLV